jgi:hypothetical protein
MKTKFIIVFLFFADFVYSQNYDSLINPFDKSIEPILGIYGYKKRDSVYEGLYNSPVSSSFDVVSFTKGKLRYNLYNDHHITLMNELSKKIRIRAVSIPLALFYRLDATISRNDTIKWNLDNLIRPLSIKDEYLGIYGFLNDNNGVNYLPITILNSSDSLYHIYFRTNCDIVNPIFTISEINNFYCDIIQNTIRINRSFIPGEAIELEISCLRSRKFCITIVANNSNNEQLISKGPYYFISSF